MISQMRQEHIRILRDEGFGYTTIAKELGLSKDQVSFFCRKNGLAHQARDTGRIKPKHRWCRNCGRDLPDSRHVYCSSKCAHRFQYTHPDIKGKGKAINYTCAYCGKAFTVYGQANRKYCSHQCYINDRYGEKGHSND